MDRGGGLPPAAERAVRRFIRENLPRRRCAPRPAPRTPCGRSPNRTSPGRRWVPSPPPALRGRCAPPRRRGRARQRHPLRLGGARGDDASGSGPWRTSWSSLELGEDHPGALVDALQVFSAREINLTRIESRPLRQGLGRYQFFLDIEGAAPRSPWPPRSRRCGRRRNRCECWAAGRSRRRRASRLVSAGCSLFYNRAGNGQRGHRRAGCGQRP